MCSASCVGTTAKVEKKKKLKRIVKMSHDKRNERHVAITSNSAMTHGESVMLLRAHPTCLSLMLSHLHQALKLNALEI